VVGGVEPKVEAGGAHEGAQMLREMAPNYRVLSPEALVPNRNTCQAMDPAL